LVRVVVGVHGSYAGPPGVGCDEGVVRRCSLRPLLAHCFPLLHRLLAVMRCSLPSRSPRSPRLGDARWLRRWREKKMKGGGSSLFTARLCCGPDDAAACAADEEEMTTAWQ
ncbi:hypothetical protein Dimus_033221, partial [Dionaea muscipula]